MVDRLKCEEIFRRNGFDNYHWISAKDILTAQWVRFKCYFGCPTYGKKGTCPPSVPSVGECREFFSGYHDAVVFRIPLPDSGKAHDEWSRRICEALLQVERDVFLCGCRKSFVLFMEACSFCSECVSQRAGCLRAADARPSPEALAVDVIGTLQQCGLPVADFGAPESEISQYAFLMVD